MFSDWRPPEGFGDHPELRAQIKSVQRRARKIVDFRLMMGKPTTFEELQDARHPRVALIPRSRYLQMVDESGESAMEYRVSLPFSSTDFWVETDEHPGAVFYELTGAVPFMRLGEVSQLGYLIPPRPEAWDPSQKIGYIPPIFRHTRWSHSLLVACLMEIVLARGGFGPEERNPMVLAAGCHDIAMPAGGDPVQAMDPEELDEEKNFSWVLSRYGLAERWSRMFGFNLQAAQGWVENHGLAGMLLDALDKIAYTALDCYQVGSERPSLIMDFCVEHPLVMDVWQDIRFTQDRTGFGFVSSSRLYDFLVLRALEHTEFLLNPDSRRLDLYLVHKLRPLYEQGIITKEDLLLQGNRWLEQTLRRFYPSEIKVNIEPDLLGWERFETKEEQEAFCRSIGEDRVERGEEIHSFNPGLYLPVLGRQGEIREAREVFSSKQVETLERMARAREGYYVYYYR